MDCFQDFCLACDRDASGRESRHRGYCSEACFLADLEKTSPSTPNSPSLSSTSSHRSQPSWASSSSGYFFPQPYKFPNYAPSDRSSQPPRSPKQPTRQETMDSRRSLTPSSSRTSLSSNGSHSSSSSMSERAKLELHEYSSAFHQTRSSKRRQSTW